MPACLVRIVVSSHSHPVTTHEMYECTMSRAWTSAQRTLMEKRRLFRRQQQCSRIIYVEYMCFGKSTTQNGIRTGNERIALARKLYPHTSDAFKCFRISVSRNGTISSQTARARLHVWAGATWFLSWRTVHIIWTATGRRGALGELCGYTDMLPAK